MVIIDYQELSRLTQRVYSVSSELKTIWNDEQYSYFKGKYVAPLIHTIQQKTSNVEEKCQRLYTLQYKLDELG